MDEHLSGRRFLAADHATIADLACYSYVAHAPEGGIALDGYASVLSWLRRVEALPHFKPIPPLPIPRELEDRMDASPFNPDELTAQTLAGADPAAAAAFVTPCRRRINSFSRSCPVFSLPRSIPRDGRLRPC